MSGPLPYSIYAERRIAVMIDGKLYSGKKELTAVYASLTQQAIESDSPELLEKYLGLELLFETSIWDVKVRGGKQ